MPPATLEATTSIVVVFTLERRRPYRHAASAHSTATSTRVVARSTPRPSARLVHHHARCVAVQVSTTMHTCTHVVVLHRFRSRAASCRRPP